MSREHAPRLRTLAIARCVLLAACLGAPGAGGARADGDRDRAMPRDVPPTYLQECAACHLAYPPGLLPAPSWQRLMAGLERHFGTDASLDPAETRRLDAWLQANAGRSRRVAQEPPQDRITRSDWFARAHRKVGTTDWLKPEVGSAARCAACHAGAERGRFDDPRIPGGSAPTRSPTSRD